MGMMFLFTLIFLGTTMPGTDVPYSADEAVLGLPSDCEFVAFADLRSAYPNVSGLIENLAAQSFITSNPEINTGLAMWPLLIEEVRSEGVSTFGVDPFEAFHAASFCVRWGTDGSGDPLPDFVLFLQGEFDAGIAARWATEVGLTESTLPNGLTVFGDTEDGRIIGVVSPRDGLLVGGSESMLQEVLGAPGTTPPYESFTHSADSLTGHLATTAEAGLRAYVGFQPSTATYGLVPEMDSVSGQELVLGLERAVYAVNDSATLLFVDANAAGFRDYELILTGVGDLLTATPHALSGIVEMMLGGMAPMAAEFGPAVTQLVLHREDLLTFLSTMGLTTEPTITLTTDDTTHEVSLLIEGANPAIMTAGAALPFLFLSMGDVGGSGGSGSTDWAVEESSPMLEVAPVVPSEF